MEVQQIDRVSSIDRETFEQNYLLPSRPIIITELSRLWPALSKWSWDYFKQLAGDKEVPVYNNTRAGAKVPVNGGDGFMKFGDYIDLIRQGPSEWRVFLFNLFRYAPVLKKDFGYPEELLSGFLKAYPMLFVGGAGSIAHMHYDLDLAHIFHTQFVGKKRVLLLDNSQSNLIYRMPSTVESAASFVNWQEGVDTDRFPGLKYAKAYTSILGHGETLFMPTGYWHHMQYMESGFAMSLRAIPAGVKSKINTIYHLAGMRGFNNMLIKLAPQWWYHYKRKVANENAERAIKELSGDMAGLSA